MPHEDHPVLHFCFDESHDIINNYIIIINGPVHICQGAPSLRGAGTHPTSATAEMFCLFLHKSFIYLFLALEYLLLQTPEYVTSSSYRSVQHN